MVKKNKESKKKVEFNAQFWMSIVLLGIMVLSIAGFAMISAGPTSKSSVTNQNIPLQYFDQYGVWAAVVNGEQFIFKDINQYQPMIDLVGLSSNIKSKENIEIYVDTNYDPSSVILLEKALDALKINYKTINTPICNENSLILTNNELNLTGNCMIFLSQTNQTYDRTNGLVYNLIK